MNYLPFWLSGAALALIPILHWLLVRRMLAVSGRFSKLVDRARFGPEEVEEEMSEEEMIAAIQAMALEEFGDEAVAADEGDTEASEESEGAALNRPPPQPLWLHAGFLLALAVGGALSQALRGGIDPSFSLASTGFDAAFGGMSPMGIAALFVGGLFIGWGTRMAGGCTSGHGLCGVSRAQAGSLIATASFFGAGIIVSFAIGALV